VADLGAVPLTFPVPIYPANTPRLTIVTPSFNQGEFLERTIDSVLSQGHPNLEYFIVDGGSTDSSVEIIRRHEKHLAWWTSERDRGQVHAINKGLARATGEWVGWQNSDDVYLPGSFAEAAQQMTSGDSAGLVAGDLLMIDKNECPLREIRYVQPTFRSLRAEGMVIANQSAWWKTSLHASVGFLDEDYNCSFDYDWFLRLLLHTHARYVNKTLGAIRMHGESKTSMLSPQFSEQNAAILRRHGGIPSRWERHLFQLRRGVLTAARGDLRYIFCGLRNRLAPKI